MSPFTSSALAAFLLAAATMAAPSALQDGSLQKRQRETLKIKSCSNFIESSCVGDAATVEERSELAGGICVSLQAAKGDRHNMFIKIPHGAKCIANQNSAMCHRIVAGTSNVRGYPDGPEPPSEEVHWGEGFQYVQGVYALRCTYA
jgi:hypothetical protein